jgi:hypothetical protein
VRRERTTWNAYSTRRLDPNKSRRLDICRKLSADARHLNLFVYLLDLPIYILLCPCVSLIGTSTASQTRPHTLSSTTDLERYILRTGPRLLRDHFCRRTPDFCRITTSWSHGINMSFPAYTPKARVQKPAPHFSGTAVVDGTFEGTYHTQPDLLCTQSHPN